MRLFYDLPTELKGGARHLVADNVAEAFPLLVRGREGQKITEAYGNVSPPFANLVVSMRLPTWKRQPWSEACVQIVSDVSRVEDRQFNFTAAMFVRWLDGRVYNIPRAALLRLDEGKVTHYGILRPDKSFVVDVETDRDDNGNLPSQVLNQFLGISLQAIELWNTKPIPRLHIEPPGKLVRKHERKHGRRLQSHYELVIDPTNIADIVRRERARVERARNRDHECRGHHRWQFIGRRLPPGYEGPHNAKSMWISPHRRGDKALGSVTKTYVLRPTGT